MKTIILAVCILTAPFTMHAQLKGLINRAKDKVNQRVNTKADQAIDKALDEAEGKKTAPPPKEEAKPTPEPEIKVENTVTGYSKFDFVPGDRILYTEDFAQDVIGELPVNWNSSGKGEIMTLDSKPGKWLKAFQGNTYLTGNTKSFGENFTVEFDMIYFFKPKASGYVLPNPTFGIFSSGEKETTDNAFLHNQTTINALEVNIHPYSSSTAVAHSYKKGASTFTSTRATVNDYMGQFNKVQHYAIQVQKQRFRMWINENKVFDIPRAVNLGDTLNQLMFKLEGSNYKDEEIGLYLTNIKVATGVPDTRHKLIEEGKFSTTGILFDFQSAVIKKESYGIIKEIAGVLKENATVNIKVVGHTSNDGNETANVELSKQRAAAVKELLIKDFGVEENRLKTDGKGASQPVADTKTPEGKAQNRRVEFVKI